jgi:hypothetical protein
MKNQAHKGVRDMPVKRSPQDKGLVATIQVHCYDNGKWLVNGDPCQDDLTGGPAGGHVPGGSRARAREHAGALAEACLTD